MLKKEFLVRNNKESQKANAEELWIAFQQDNREAFSILFLRYYEQLFLYGMNFSGREEIVKDAIQKLFFRLWEKRKVIDNPSSVAGYLYVSLRRILLRAKRREQARGERNLEYLSEMELGDILDIEEKIIWEEEQREQIELYKEALKSLTPRQKEALLLRLNSGMSNEEIAGIMDITEKRVRNLIYEARTRLRKRIYELTE